MLAVYFHVASQALQRLSQLHVFIREPKITFPDTSPKLCLYRPESQNAVAATKFGSFTLAQPFPGLAISLLALTLTLVVVLFCMYGSVTRKARLVGIVVPSNGTAIVASTSAGVLNSIFVHEGEMVRAGQPLFEILHERNSVDGNLSALLRREIDVQIKSLNTERTLRRRQYQEKTEEINRRQKILIAETQKLKQEVELAKQKRDFAQLTSSRFQSLLQSGDVSIVQAQQASEDLIDSLSKLNALERTLIQLEQSHLSLISERELNESSLAIDLNRSESSIAKLQQEVFENSGRRSHILKAPSSGKIAAIAYERGQSVQSGQMLAHLLPIQSDPSAEPVVEAHLYAASHSAGFIETGQEVLLRFDAYPYQKFGVHKGVITSMSLTPFNLKEIPVNLAASIGINNQIRERGDGFATEEFYRVKVRLDQQEIRAYERFRKLKPGTTLSATITLEKRTIWEWLIAPILAAAKYMNYS